MHIPRSFFKFSGKKSKKKIIAFPTKQLNLNVPLGMVGLVGLMAAALLALVGGAQTGYNATITMSVTNVYMSMFAIPDSDIDALSSDVYPFSIKAKNDDDGYAATILYTDLNTHVLTVVGIHSFTIDPLDAGVCNSHPLFGLGFDVFEIDVVYDDTMAAPFMYQVSFVRPDGCYRRGCGEKLLQSGTSSSLTCAGDVDVPISFSLTLTLV
jgi:hypothetical protein